MPSDCSASRVEMQASGIHTESPIRSTPAQWLLFPQPDKDALEPLGKVTVPVRFNASELRSKRTLLHAVCGP